MPTVSKADMKVLAAKELTQALKQNVPNAIPAMNGKVLMKLAAIFDEIAQKKLPEKDWGEPASLRVLEVADRPKVTKPIPILRVEESPERLIVTSSKENEIVVSPPALNTRSR